MIKHSFKKLVNNEFFRNVLTVFTGTSLSQSIPVIIMPILTRLYPEDIFGVFFIYSASVMILTIIATLKYELAIVLAENQEDAFNLLFLTLIISFFISIFIGTLCFIFSSLIGKLLNNNGIIPWLPLLPISVFLVSTFRAFQFWCNRNK